MNEENLNDDLMGDDETYEVISMVDDNGLEKDYFVVDGIEVDNNKYILVVASEDFDKDEPEAYLLKEIEEENDEVIYEPVENDDEYNKIIVLLQDNDGDYEMQF